MATFGTFTAGQVLTAGELNAAGTYTAFTPTLGGVTLGNGTRNARYTKFNKLVHYFGRFDFGSTSAITGQITIDLPAAAYSAGVAADGQPAGWCQFTDAGIATYTGLVLRISNTSFYLYPQNTAGTYANLAGTSATIPFTWGTNDSFTWNVVYEAA